ncbi:MAG: hypothetical protein EU539_05965 [Promethearchaeota archaeon]|nr:MAG: hypothetical protein EU539_05965 [Candidatus Lokiarchaeota archaeon]
MPKSRLDFLELIRKYWFYAVIAAIFVIFLFNRLLAIWITFGFLIVVVFLYLPSLSFEGKLIKYMKKHNAIEDKIIAKQFKRPLDEIKERMENLTTKQKRKKWLIVGLNNRYVFYNEDTIDKFKDYYKMGFNEKRIFDNLRKDAKIRTRAEIKGIKDTLINLNKIKKSSESTGVKSLKKKRK